MAANAPHPQAQSEVVSAQSNSSDRRAVNISDNDEEKLVGQGYGDCEGYGCDGGGGYSSDSGNPQVTIVANAARNYVDRATINITPDGNIEFADDE